MGKTLLTRIAYSVLGALSLGMMAKGHIERSTTWICYAAIVLIMSLILMHFPLSYGKPLSLSMLTYFIPCIWIYAIVITHNCYKKWHEQSSS